ncbi:MAG: putative metal-dependent hydrolase [Acidobacteriia bacterium]|nr:putative metal-dependent hydrolase [Terriglobia bacterium]
MSDPRYPIGPFSPDAHPTPASRARHIEEIAALPGHFRQAVAGLSNEQLDTPYRDGGWTVKQLAHHVPDSHMNAYIRFKLALTENTPTIKPYDENAWAKLKDSEQTPVEVSLTLLEALHTRWVNLLKSLKADDFERKLNHPESGVFTLDQMLALYAWHGKHHTAHVTSLRQRKKW